MSATIMENRMEIPQKNYAAITSQGIYVKGIKSLSSKGVCIPISLQHYS